LNACSLGYENIKRIDSLILENVFGGKAFRRLHSKCGMAPFIELN
jgi:hypothetical protein